MPHDYRSGGLEKSAVVRTVPGIFIGFSGFNNGPDQFILLFDAAAVPSANAVPLKVCQAYAGQPFAFAQGERGVNCLTGIVIANSSSGSAYVAGAADCLFNVSHDGQELNAST